MKNNLNVENQQEKTDVKHSTKSSNDLTWINVIFPEGCKTKSGIVFWYCKTNILQLLSDIFSDVTIVSLLSSLYRYYHPCIVTIIFSSLLSSFRRYYHPCIVTIILVSLLSSLYRYYHLFVVTIILRWCYYHRSFALLSSSLFFQRRFSVHKNSMQDKITHDRICC